MSLLTTVHHLYNVKQKFTAGLMENASPGHTRTNRQVENIMPRVAHRISGGSIEICLFNVAGTLAIYMVKYFATHTLTHTRLTALFPGLPRWAGTRKVKPIWILLKQETASGISWAICKSAPRSRQITTPATITIKTIKVLTTAVLPDSYSREYGTSVIHIKNAIRNVFADDKCTVTKITRATAIEYF